MGSQRNTYPRLFVEWTILLIASMALVIVAQQRGLAERFDLSVLDFGSSVVGAQADPEIVLIEIDERSLETFGSWPWGRDLHATLIRNLSAAQPKAIGVDILYLEPSTAEADASLGDAIAETGNAVLAHSFTGEAFLDQHSAPLLPIPEIAAGAAAVGHVAIEPDIDGTVRRFDLHLTEGGETYRHFIAALLQEADNFSPKGRVIVPFSNQGDFTTQSASEVIDNAFVKDVFKDKIVLIGATAQGLGDQYSVPGYAGGLMSGVEMQANLLSAIKQDATITRVPPNFALALQLLALVLLFIAFWKSTPRASLVIAATLLATLLAITLGALWIGHLWLATGPALLAIALAYPLWAWRRLATVSRFLEAEARSLRSMTDDPNRREGEGFDVVARQVSRLKTLTGEIRQNFNLVQGVLNASPDPMLVFDANGKIAMANPASTRLFGSSCLSEHWDFETLLEASNASFDSERNELEFHDQRCFLLARAAIDPSVGSELWVLREITGIKADERQRRETLEFLSHDMRSPQVAIIGLTGTAGDTLDKQDRLDRIESQARRTLKLTDDFVQIARISTEGIHREEVELNSILFETADRAFPLAHRKGITIETIESDEPMFVKLDPAAIARALDNLVGNAIKFSPDKAKITLSVDVSNDQTFEIKVSDEGPGLPPERVKEPFARFGAKSTGSGPSAGLGLAYVKQVIDKHAGSIKIETAEGKGTEFRISIPYS